MINWHSILRLNAIEVIAAGAAGAGMVYVHRALLWASVPFGSYIYEGPNPVIGATTSELVWAAFGSSLFYTFSIPFALFAAISAIALVRFARNDVRDFSRLGQLALAWPLLGNFLVFILNWCGGWCWATGLLMALAAYLVPKGESSRKAGDLLAVGLNTIWLLLAALYASQWWSAYGD